jgi:hypothetical protein
MLDGTTARSTKNTNSKSFINHQSELVGFGELDNSIELAQISRVEVKTLLTIVAFHANVRQLQERERERERERESERERARERERLSIKPQQ